MEHLSLHSVRTYHKKFGWEKEKIKYILPSVQGWHSAKHALPSVIRRTFGKEAFLPNAKAWRSVKMTAIRFRRLLTVLCRALPFVECLALGKYFFAECIYVS
jgi:hypothetical protein